MEGKSMDISEKRTIGALLLLTGFSCLAIGLHTGQLGTVIDFVKKIFEAAVAGRP